MALFDMFDFDLAIRFLDDDQQLIEQNSVEHGSRGALCRIQQSGSAARHFGVAGWEACGGSGEMVISRELDTPRGDCAALWTFRMLLCHLRSPGR